MAATTVATCYALTVFLLTSCPVTQASGFLRSNANLTAEGLAEELNHAVESALGCGGEDGHARERLDQIKKELFPMWQVLPKNSYGRIERRSLRYVAHLHFMRTASIMIRGFEPLKVVNDSQSGAADILSQRVPAYVEQVLEGKKVSHGFSLDDAATMVAIVEQLIYDSENVLLEASYKHLNKSHRASLNHRELSGLMEVYLVHWFISDARSIRVLLANKTKLETTFPHWGALADFAAGQVSALEYSRQQKPMQGRGFDTLSQRFTFHDAHEVAGGITRSFASFWNSECVSMKEDLVAMDTDSDGRVPLSKFYASALAGDWRFSESEAYLREIGALDESSIWKGKQVIIPNWVQSANNCIVSTSHYSVCCRAECEGLLSEIEIAVGAPLATLQEILLSVGKMSSVSASLSHEKSPQLEGPLTAQLQRVATAHGGKVPLHSRLFLQWLHYVFPHECPFPHKAGTANATAPNDYGGTLLASKDEMKEHASVATPEANAIPDSENAAGEEMPSMWSEEEDFFADYDQEDLSAPWGLPGLEGRWLLRVLAFALAVLAFCKQIVSANQRASPVLFGLFDSSDKMLKSHMV